MSAVERAVRCRSLAGSTGGRQVASLQLGLNADRERLPVFLDEVFVNWDQPRRHAAFEILENMAQKRQLFVFTCHPYFAREVARHLDAERLDLTALHTDGNATPEAHFEESDLQNEEASR